jgi:alpha-tubulin suppressor-like RCC1 family protein
VGEVRFTTLSAGADHTCGLTSTGDVYCWGSSPTGAAGAGGTVPTPTRVTSSVPFVSVTAGGSHTCALSADGSAYCWGTTDATGLTSFPNTCPFSQPCATAPMRTATALTFATLRAGSTHTCGITIDGKTWCWGWNTLGEVGAGEFGSSRASPQEITGGPALQQLESRFRFNCGLTDAGELHCWGWGQEGQLGTTALSRCTLAIMDLLCSPVPVPAATQRRFSLIALGSAFGCGLENGAIHCWGENGQGQLGRPTPGPGVAPVESPGGTWIGLAAGYFHACAIQSDGAPYCWGSNIHGELGAGLHTRSTTVVSAVGGGLRFTQMVAGRDHTCGLTAAGVAWCWGAGRFGQLGSP